jgi:type IV secretory pathway ATPase VirB11/archaellum biosynthesis ATPase
MRLSPRRIIVGEVRGAEALEMLKAWNTGHPGGIATIHANSAADVPVAYRFSTRFLPLELPEALSELFATGANGRRRNAASGLRCFAPRAATSMRMPR